MWRDSGAGAVLVLSGLGLVLTCFLGALTLVGALAAHQRAQVAADFAALAAASRSWQGSSAACDQGSAEMTGRNSSPLAQVIVVVGARGGAGASSLAVALAQSSAQEGKRTVLLDADELGGGIDLVLGAEGHRGVRRLGPA